jgi:hypothetical protein
MEVVMTTWRRIFAALAWLYFSGVLVQFFLAGSGLPALGGAGMDAHAEFGYIALHMTPVLLVTLSLVTRSGRRLILLSSLLALVAFMQPIWVDGFRGSFIASFHVLGAAPLLVLSYQVARFEASTIPRESIAI